MPIAVIVQSRARWNVYPLKMSIIKICSAVFDRHRRRYNRQYVHTWAVPEITICDVNARWYERKSNGERSWIYLHENSPQTLRYIEMKISEGKAWSRSNRRYANYVEDIWVRFSQKRKNFFFVFIELNRNCDTIDKFDRQLRGT